MTEILQNTLYRVLNNSNTLTPPLNLTSLTYRNDGVEQE